MPELHLQSNVINHVRVMVPGRMLTSLTSLTSRGEADLANQLRSAMRHAFGGHFEMSAGETK